MPSWVVYIVECSDGTLYTGCTNDLRKRLKDHNAGKGAKYTRGRLPVCLVYTEDSENKSSALKREYRIKKMSRLNKEKLIFGFNSDYEDPCAFGYE